MINDSNEVYSNNLRFEYDVILTSSSFDQQLVSDLIKK